ncbi:MAG: porin family protein [Deltaproteobacteria bacterium]|nr:porin family protein [Deltaproteobacteria bacterium]
MIQKITIFVILLACAFFATNIADAADAADKNYYIGISELYAIENLDEQHTKDKFSGPIEIDFDNSWGVRVRGGYIVTKYFTSEALFEYLEAKTGTNINKFDVMNFTLNGKFTCPEYETAIPYAVVGIGVMNAYEDITFNGATSKTSDWGASLRAGLGIDYYASEEVSLQLEGAYTAGLGCVDHVRYTTIAFGIAYHF